MITNTYLIGKHLVKIEKQDEIEICAMCGASNIPGYPIKDVIKATFMDNELLNNRSKHLCIYCAACIGKDVPMSSWVRAHSFFATKKKLQFLKREDLWNNIFSPPETPFVFGVTYSHKKHISFKTEVNFSKKKFMIKTENESVIVIKKELNSSGVLTAMKNWYTICNDKKIEPTWFTKNDILTGCTNFSKIEKYGRNKYLLENKVIKPYRQTALLKLLAHSLNKGAFKKND